MKKSAASLKKTGLDDLDYKIIVLLQEDGRLSASEIAGRIGNIAERTVRNRIANLLQHKHIVISAIPAPTMVGKDVQADLLIETEPGQADAVARQMVEYDQVGYLCAMTGQYNLGASVMADCNASLHEFIETEISTISGSGSLTINKGKPRRLPQQNYQSDHHLHRLLRFLLASPQQRVYCHRR